MVADARGPRPPLTWPRSAVSRPNCASSECLAGGATARRRPGRNAGAAGTDRSPGRRRRDGATPGELLGALEARRARRSPAGRRARGRHVAGQDRRRGRPARDRWFSPHAWANGLGLLANLHVAAGVGGGPYLEFPFDPPGWTGRAGISSWPSRSGPGPTDACGCRRPPGSGRRSTSTRWPACRWPATPDRPLLTDTTGDRRRRRIRFIGLGRMGGPMSGNVLAAGHDLIVHDTPPGSGRPAAWRPAPPGPRRRVRPPPAARW